ncbi:MAG: zinc ribbon domain-containing protein [Candidatus Paceibacterota bacterium]
MFCPNCGKQISNDSKFCIFCGKEFLVESVVGPVSKPVSEDGYVKVFNHEQDDFLVEPVVEPIIKDGNVKAFNRGYDYCQVCGDYAPTKYVEFYQNIGMFLARQSKSIKGKLCKNCINKNFGDFTLTTLFLGWWGIISFFLTPFYILNNIFRYLTCLRLKAIKKEKAYSAELNFFRRTKNFFAEKSNYLKLLKYFAILLVAVFFIWIISSDDSSNDSGTKTSLPLPAEEVSSGLVVSQPSGPAFSLPNGTIIKKNNYYLQGDGELQIKNGTNLDAVAKLIHGGTSGGKSILTVYIKANSTYTILDISDGIYWLVFAQGSDWDSTSQKFKRNTQYSAFEDTFDFTTAYSEYTIFEVTLNPVVGGTAETNDVPASQFDQY